jgi:hypothetical protein
MSLLRILINCETISVINIVKVHSITHFIQNEAFLGVSTCQGSGRENYEMHEFGRKYLTTNEHEEAYCKRGCIALKNLTFINES